jgi:hypothetical protein
MATGPRHATCSARPGDGLDFEAGRIVFENSVVVKRDSELVTTWNDSSIVFRAPTPASGTFVEDENQALEAGWFEAAPWRPAWLGSEEEPRRRLDWAMLDAGTMVEATWVGGALEIAFIEPNGARTIQQLQVDVGDAKLVAMGPDAVEGYFFDAREDEELGWIRASRGGVELHIEASGTVILSREQR